MTFCTAAMNTDEVDALASVIVLFNRPTKHLSVDAGGSLGAFGKFGEKLCPREIHMHTAKVTIPPNMAPCQICKTTQDHNVLGKGNDK